MKFRKKPIVIEAVHFDGNNHRECHDFIEGNHDSTVNYLNIKTLEGTMRVKRGDWIIKGVNGEFYPVKDDIFHLTYESVGVDE